LITDKISPKDLLHGARKFLTMKAGRTLFSVNLEVTRRCNLKCDFCDYWRQRGPESRLSDYSPIVRKLDPLHLTITGGEPLLRKDLEQIIAGIRMQPGFIYMNLITNGSLLTVERALALWNAGLNQLSVSLDFPDERHDRHRGYPGLWRHIEELLPGISAAGVDNLCLNTIIMKENLDSLLDIAAVAKEWKLKVSFSTYNPFKNGNSAHTVPPDRIRRLEQVVADLLAWKRNHGNITSSDFYLQNVPRYLREGGISGCLAGRKWVQVSPDGTLRRCSEKEELGAWRDFSPRQVPHTSCRECWYACRGESEAPLGIKRIAELNR
jgi:MoaA/NifB/PqqE/SkfB family radical SAM enzyme